MQHPPPPRQRRLWSTDLFLGRQRRALDGLIEILERRGRSVRVASPLGRTFLLTSDPVVLRRALVTAQSRYTTSDVRGVEEHFRANVLPNGQPAWRVMHSLVMRAPVDEPELVQRWVQAAGRALPVPGVRSATRLDLFHFAKTMWNDGLTELLFGRAVPESAERVGHAFEALLGRLASPAVHSVPGYLRLPTPGNRRFLRLVHEARADMAAQVAQGGARPWCIMAALERAASPAFTADDRLEIAMAFFFNSSATVSSSLAWLLWHVASDPALQQRLREEEATGQRARPLLDACIAETLRLYTPIHLGRHALRDDVEGDGPPVREGTDLISNAWLIHRNPNLWSAPDVFQPERFLGGRIPWSAYLPFSMGPRGCPGRSVTYAVLRAVASHTLRHVELDAVAGVRPEFRRSLVVATMPVSLPARVVALRTGQRPARPAEKPAGSPSSQYAGRPRP